MDRIRQRNRECEKDISPDYIGGLNKYYNDWYDKYEHKKLIIDTDELDFLMNGNHFNKLIGKISDSIEQQDMFSLF
jgi:deoxyadenosine/deoxycytidine kinase